MNRGKRKKRLILLLILVLTITIGYAAITTTLKINGNSTVKAQNWSIYWDNVQVTTGSVTGANVTTAPTTTGTTTTEVEYAVTLPEPGDFYEFTVDAVNNGTIDAMIATNGVIKGVYSDSNYTTTATLPKAVSYTVTYADDQEIEANHLLAKKTNNTPTRETYKVRVQYRNDSEITASDLTDISTDTTYYFKFSVEYVQADSTKVARNGGSQTSSSITYVTRQNEGQITPGDVVKIGDSENFYVISSDSTKTTLLAKYNLLVGYETDDGGSTYTPMTAANTSGYGLQSASAYGFDGSLGEYKGMVAFSQTNYWDDGDGNLVSPYNANGASYDGNPYPSIYNKTIKTEPDFANDGFETTGYSIAYYVEEYVDALEQMGAPSTIEGRLLTYEEAEAKKNIQDSGTSIILGENQFYWLGSANYEFYPLTVERNQYNDSINYSNSEYYGVRPVIEIPTSELN